MWPCFILNHSITCVVKNFNSIFGGTWATNNHLCTRDGHNSVMHMNNVMQPLNAHPPISYEIFLKIIKTYRNTRQLVLQVDVNGRCFNPGHRLKCKPNQCCSIIMKYYYYCLTILDLIACHNNNKMLLCVKHQLSRWKVFHHDDQSMYETL